MTLSLYPFNHTGLCWFLVGLPSGKAQCCRLFSLGQFWNRQQEKDAWPPKENSICIKPPMENLELFYNIEDLGADM
jgi:hypothetical protein